MPHEGLFADYPRLPFAPYTLTDARSFVCDLPPSEADYCQSQSFPRLSITAASGRNEFPASGGKMQMRLSVADDGERFRLCALFAAATPQNNALIQNDIKN